MPDVTEDNEWYEFPCDHKGKFINLVTARDDYLSIQNIEVYAEFEIKQDFWAYNADMKQIVRERFEEANPRADSDRSGDCDYGY